jgi:hypothetical protein
MTNATQAQVFVQIEKVGLWTSHCPTFVLDLL